jgi:hypothetical protein
LDSVSLVAALLSAVAEDHDRCVSRTRIGLDKPVSTSTLESVEAASRKFFAERGMIFRWTGYDTKQVKKWN